MHLQYYNTYPAINSINNTEDSSGNAIDKESIKSCIKDFNDAMISSGLIRTNSPNQLDFENFPIFNYLDHVANPSLSYDMIAHEYPPLIYTFNDELNAQHPCYIKVVFDFHSAFNNTKSSKNNCFLLGAKLSISKNENFNTFHEVRLTRQIYTGASNAERVMKTEYTNHGFSEIINSKNTFFMNICPNYSHFISSNSNLNLSLINATILRNEDGSIILMTSTDPINIATTSDSTLNSYAFSNNDITLVPLYNQRAYMITAQNNKITDTVGNTYDSFIQNSILGGNTNVYVSPTQFVTDKSYVNYNLLIMNRTFTAQKSKLSNIKVKLPDGTIGKYKVVGYPAYPVRYYDNDKCVLIKIDDDE